VLIISLYQFNGSHLATAVMITQNLTSTSISTMATENLSVFSTLLLDVAKVTVPDDLADEDNVDNYDGIAWKRPPDLQKPHHSLKQTLSFIYKYGYRCQSWIKLEQIIFISMVQNTTIPYRYRESPKLGDSD
jgi:hypothetical protein